MFKIFLNTIVYSVIAFLFLPMIVGMGYFIIEGSSLEDNNISEEEIVSELEEYEEEFYQYDALSLIEE